jgi:tRNA1(Val) A37 N6-methylase TrmN6
MKKIDDLLNYKGLKIVQDSEGFCFSLDSVLLARFVTINKAVKNIIDLGTGNAPIPLVLSTRTDASIVGVEIQKKPFNLALESTKLNNLESQIKIINHDLKDVYKIVGREQFDVTICNPPFFKLNKESHLNEIEYKRIARHEITATLEDVIKSASILLKNGGLLALVQRPERFVETIELMKKYRIEPKRLQMVYPKMGRDANMFLIEGKKNGNPGLKILGPLYAHNEDGSYSKEVLKFFE